MNENTAFVLVLALATVWNVFLWAAFIYMIVHMSVSLWILIIPCLFTVFPKSKSDEKK